MDRTILISQLLDFHLSRAIAREHLKDGIMRKFIQLAEDVEADLKELDNDADELDRRRRDGKERAKAVVNTHHRLQDRIDEGISALEKVADNAGLARPNTRTAAELAAIEAEEAAQKGKTEGLPEEPKLGEASGDTPATFQKAAE
jgi:hypothetical protein